MKIVKYEGATMREALAKVKAELGEHAMIVSTRQVRHMLGSSYEVSVAIENEGPSQRSPLARNLPPGFGPSAKRPVEGEGIHADGVRSELRTLRAMVRAGGDPRATDELRGEIASLRRIVENLNGGANAIKAERALPSIAEVAKGGRVCASSCGSVVALVGPTGVGKTTTIAKIAARAALVEKKRVAIITLDNYRVGGVDQIRTFAELIGVPLAVANSPADLAAHVEDFADRDLILVDTAGRSPREKPAIEELAHALNAVSGIEVHLCIAAGTTPEVLDDLHARYAPLRPSRLLFTKLDETGAAPEVVRGPVRIGLPVTWITIGQAVPEDLELATSTRMIELANHGLRTPKHSTVANNPAYSAA